jgi:hypothetical protein
MISDFISTFASFASPPHDYSLATGFLLTGQQAFQLEYHGSVFQYFREIRKQTAKHIFYCSDGDNREPNICAIALMGKTDIPVKVPLL